MKQVIVVKTSAGREHWAQQITENFKGYSKYPVIFLKSDFYYMWPVVEYINADEFFFIHDSIVITDFSMFDIAFDKWKGKSVSIGGQTKTNNSVYQPFVLGMGKVKMDLIKKIKYPKFIKSNRDDRLFEVYFSREYFNLDQDTEVLVPDFTGEGPVVDIFGEKRRKITTPYFIKYQRAEVTENDIFISPDEYNDWQAHKKLFSNYI